MKVLLVFSTKRGKHKSKHEVICKGSLGLKLKSVGSITKRSDANQVEQNNRGKLCIFCNETGHKRYNWPKKHDYGKKIANVNDAWIEFTKQLKNLNHFNISDISEARKQFKYLLRDIISVAIYDKISNQVLLCSYILKGGRLHGIYHKYPFSLD